MSLQQEALEGRPTAVYRLWDQTCRLLYVGMSGNPDQRCLAHKVTKLWWNEVFCRTEDWYQCRSEAEAEEQRAITAEKPRYNVVGATESEGHGLQIDYHRSSPTLRIPPDLIAKARAHLSKSGWTAQEFVIAALTYYVTNPREVEKQLEPFKPPRKRGRPRKKGC